MGRTSKFSNAATKDATTLWRAALYVRLSREDGDRPESESIQSQKLILQDFAAKNPDILVVETYSDDGYSGTSFDRPAFAKMLSDIQSGKINCVIVKDLSRFGRNYVETGRFLEVIFPTLRTRFIALNDNIDSIGKDAGSIIIPFKNIINDEYCRDISQKVRSSLTIRRQKGQFIGSFAAYGYQKDPENHSHLIIDEEAAEVVRLIFRLFLGGSSILGIAKHLNGAGIKSIAEYKQSKGLLYRAGRQVASAGAAGTELKGQKGLWSDFSVRRILKSRVYIGDMEQKKSETVSYKVRVSRATQLSERIVVENTHQPIISRECFAQVQSLLCRDTRTTPGEAQLGLFAGFVRCADCKKAMQKKSISGGGKRYEYYVCSTHKKSGGCTKHTVRQDILEGAVLTVIQKYIAIAVDFDEVAASLKNHKSEKTRAARLTKTIEDIERERNKTARIILDLYPDYKDGLLTREQFLSLKSELEGRVNDLSSAAQKLKSQKAGEADGVTVAASLVLKYKNLTALSREILTQLVSDIYVFEGGGIEIDFKFKDEFAAAAQMIESGQKLLSSFSPRPKGRAKAQ